MKKCFVIGLSVVASIFMLGCSSDSDNETSLAGETVQVVDQQSAENAIASISSIGSVASGISELNDVILYDDVVATGIGPRSVATPRETDTWNCTDGGTITLSGTETENSIDGQATFTNCVEGSETINGVMDLDGTMDFQENINLVTTFNNFVITEEGVVSSLNLTFKMETNLQTMDPLSLTLTGTAQTGNMSYGYENFNMTMQNYNSTFDDFNEYEINGKTSYQVGDVNHSCANGIYDITTLETMQRDTLGFSSGKVKVNGTTVEFQSGGTAQVTYANGETEQINQVFEVVCN